VTTYAAALAAARAELQRAGVEGPALDARLLLAAAAGLDTAGLVARDQDPMPALAEGRFRCHLKRRLRGEPVARILGTKEFWGLAFEVDSVLVPRPETETLVEAVLNEARRKFPPQITICDLGTGSGAIVIALLTELEEAKALASDISPGALATAARNAERLGVRDRLDFYLGDFAEGPAGPFDIVVSNPPYVRTGDIGALRPDVREYDPKVALDGGPDGLSAYRAILSRAARLIDEDGLLALEVGADQSEAVTMLCREYGLEDVSVRSDLAGGARAVLARRPAPCA
jgi:release factor glutamine methyltransferase